MSSLPKEVLEDVLQLQDRWTLDDVQFTNRRFLRLIMERMTDVCLRQIDSATFEAPSKDTEGSAHIRISGRPERRESWKANADSADFFVAFIKALRSSHVVRLLFSGLFFTPAFATVVLQTPVLARHLLVQPGGCVVLTPAQLRNVVLHFSPISLDMDTCQLLMRHITDEFIRELSSSPVRRIRFPDIAPLDGDSFAVTDDAIVDFCMQEDAQVRHEGDDPFGEVLLYNGSFTKDLFKRLVEASAVSTRTQPLKIVVDPVPVEEEDLRGFAQHLSYRYHGTPEQLLIYGFASEQHGPDTAMHLQIVLHPNNRLGLIRAQRPDPLFYKPDE